MEIFTDSLVKYGYLILIVCWTDMGKLDLYLRLSTGEMRHFWSDSVNETAKVRWTREAVNIKNVLGPFQVSR